MSCAKCGKDNIESIDTLCGRYCDDCLPILKLMSNGKLFQMISDDRCSTCGMIALFACSRCKSARYCNAQCQQMDWDRHSRKCGKPHVGIEIPEVVQACMLPNKRWGISREIPLSKNFMVREQTSLMSGMSGRVVSTSLNGGGQAAVKLMAMRKYTLPRTRDKTYYDMQVATIHEMEARNISDPNVAGICSAGFYSSEKKSVVPPDFAQPTDVGITMDLAYGDVIMLVDASHKERIKINRKGTFSAGEMMSLAYQMIRAVAVIHSNLIVHLDVKCDNFLVFGKDITKNRELADKLESNTLKRLALCDFGMSQGICTGNMSSIVSVGTPRYMPPELMFSSGTFSHACDVWSVACSIYATATGDHLLDDISAAGFIRLLGYSELAFAQSTKKPVDRDRINTTPGWFGNSDLASVAKLSNCEGFLNNPKFALKLQDYPGLANLLKKMLRAHPPSRISIFDAMHDQYFDSKLIRMIDSELGCARIEPIAYDYANLMVERGHVIRILDRLEKSRRRINVSKNDQTRIAVMRYIAGMFDRLRIKEGIPMPHVDDIQFRSMMIADRYLAAVTTPINVPILASAVVLLAHKYRSLPSFSHGLDIEKVFTMSRVVFAAIDFDVSGPTAFDFLRAKIFDPTKEFGESHAAASRRLRNIMIENPNHTYSEMVELCTEK